MTDTNKYELLRGSHRTADGEHHTVGDIVELSDAQASKFADEKFRKILDAEDDSSDGDAAGDDADAEDDASSDESEAEGEGDAEPDASIPEEYSELQSIATTYDGPEIDGRTSKDDIQSFLESMPEEDVVALKKAADVA